MPNRESRRLGPIAGDPHTPQAYSAAPGLKTAREAAGVDLEGLAELTGYSPDYLRRMEEEGQTAPRIVTSRISAVLSVEHLGVRNEKPGQVTRIRDIIEKGAS